MKRFLAMAILLLAGVAASADDGALGGSLVEGAYGIHALDLSTGSYRNLVRWPSRFVTGLSQIDAHRLLVSYDRGTVGGEDWLAIYDLRSNELTDLIEGSRGVYMPERGVTAYYTGYAGKHLRLADLSGKPVGIVGVEGTGYAFPVVPVSGSTFVYESRRAGAHGVWLHDLETGESKELPGLRHCSLHWAMWRSAAEELLCAERLPDGKYTGKRISTNLDGGNRRVVEFGAGRFWSGSFWPVAYLEHLDALVVQERSANLWRGEYHPLHIFRFSDGTMTEVAGNLMANTRLIYITPGTLDDLSSKALPKSRSPGIVEHILMAMIAISGAVVLWGAPLLVGFLPLWVYGHMVYRKRIRLFDVKGKIWGAAALMLSLFVSAYFFEGLRELTIKLTALIIRYGGWWTGVLLVSWLPLYVFGYFVYRRRALLSSSKGRYWGIAAALLALFLSLYFWMAAMIMGMWG